MNFDEAGDIGLVGWITSGANIPYYYWLWDDSNNCFTYAFTLCNAEIDLENQQIISRNRNGAAEYYTDYYKYDDSGELQLIKQVIEIYNDDGTTTSCKKNRGATADTVCRAPVLILLVCQFFSQPCNMG